MKRYRSPLYVYKVCSTFDSSEFTGNIGKAIELGMDVFKPDVVPVLPAAPRLKRFTVFGNHFAAMGDGTVYRLDQHPSISNQAVPPMKDADLRRHMARQTHLKSGLIDILDIEAMQVAIPIGIAAPLCYVYSNQPEINGLEVAFKGGQIGSENYFGLIRRAKTAPFEAVALGES